MFLFAVLKQQFARFCFQDQTDVWPLGLSRFTALEMYVTLL